MRKQKGVTLIEIMIVLALAGVFGFALFRFFTSTFDIWDNTFDQVGVQQPARIAMDEMAKYIRQAKPVTGLVVSHYGTELASTSIHFTLPDGTLLKYYKDGDALYRVVGSDTFTLIRENLTEVRFVPDSAASPTQVHITSMTLEKGDRSILLDRKVDLRNK